MVKNKINNHIETLLKWPLGRYTPFSDKAIRILFGSHSETLKSLSYLDKLEPNDLAWDGLSMAYNPIT